VQVRRQEFETRVANALEMASGEPEVIDAVERAFLATLPETPVELLLADNSHAHLMRVAVSAPEGEAPGCGVDSPNRCPVARRAQVQRFEDCNALDACPKLRDRPQGRCSAVCVPVSIMGRTVGVIHALGKPDQEFDEATVQDLSTLANLAGARIGLLRVMSETQLQAATDALTGLMNRRSLENEVAILRMAKTRMVTLMADLDHFKQLNDTYGHETGDRALRAFAQALRSAVRADDLVARYGGEEFAVVMPEVPLGLACETVEAVRATVAEGLRSAGLPEVTASFGVVEASEGEELYELLARADAALLDAKREGRDRVVVHDRYGRVVDVSARGPRLVVP
jgi:diguanylate cyclase (GGDEF)-like protein